MMIRFSPRRLLTVIVLAGVTNMAFGLTSSDAAAQSVQKLRPNCTACEKDRKIFEDLNKSIDAKRKERRETDSDRRIKELDTAIDQEQRARNQATLRLDNCKKMCPASIFLPRSKEITVGTCPECEKIAKELAALLNQKKRAEGELKVLKERKAKFSIMDPAEKLVKQLTEQIRKKTRELTACEKRFCLGKPKGQNAQVTPKDLIKPKGKDTAGNPK